MSVRAYRIISKKIEDQASFNLWHDSDLLDFFRDNSENDINSGLAENGGSIELSVEVLKKALKKFKWEDKDYRISAIKNDIKWAKENDQDYVMYECY